MSEKPSTPIPETVTVRKNNFASPPAVSPLGLFKSFVGLIFLGSIFISLLALTAVSNCQLVFYILIIFYKPAGDNAVVKDVAIDAEGLGFSSQAGQRGHTVANGSPPLRRFFGAVLTRR